MARISLIAAVPFFTEHPVPQFLTNGTAATLHCAAQGSPAPIITWKLNGQGIADGTVGIVLYQNGSLTISRADSNYDGFYTCVANNGFAVSEITVVVEVTFTSSTGQQVDSELKR